MGAALLPSTGGSWERRISQSEYQLAQSSSAPSTIRKTRWWVSPASWRRRLICSVVAPICFPPFGRPPGTTGLFPPCPPATSPRPTPPPSHLPPHPPPPALSPRP